MLMKKQQIQEMPLMGQALLDNPRNNKGTAFTLAEREKYGLQGLLPEAVETIDTQLQRVLSHLETKPTDLERYIYLIALLECNETLFYKLLMSDPARFLPVVYDPTVGEACLKFGHIFRRASGMYVSLNHQGHIKEVLQNWPVKDVRFICVSTGGRILGLGDLGANGMGIPIGKLQLYTACAAVPPDVLLPILLDCGTDNEQLLQDPLYLGLTHHRPSDQVLDEFVEEFVQAVIEVFPKCCIHFEDWKGTDALRLLAKYQAKILCYNDDIQGTASVVLSGLVNAMAENKTQLKDQRILFLGGGSAGIGIANLLVSAMQMEKLSKLEAQARVSLFDVNGLIEPSRQDLNHWQKVYAHENKPSTNLVKTIELIKPTVLIGVSTQGGAFTQEVVETMSRINERPIIFALSNPTEKAECSAEQAYTWSKGKALYAAGVQFPVVTFKDKKYLPGQANNFYIFPAVSLAVYVTQAKSITDEVFIAAAKALAQQVDAKQRAGGMLFPPQSGVFKTEFATAVKVAEFIFEKGLATVAKPKDITTWMKNQLYQAQYDCLN